MTTPCAGLVWRRAGLAPGALWEKTGREHKCGWVLGYQTLVEWRMWA